MHAPPNPKKEREKRGRGKSLREKEENVPKSYIFIDVSGFLKRWVEEQKKFRLKLWKLKHNFYIL